MSLAVLGSVACCQAASSVWRDARHLFVPSHDVIASEADLPSSTLRYKVYEPLLVVGTDKFANVDVRLRVKGGGHVSQLYAIRQAIAKGLVAFYAKNEDAASALELKKTYIAYDRTLLVADPRRCEPKKFGGRGARARRQKSYR